MSGLFCQRHEEYSHSGVCRWCEPAADEYAHIIGKPLAVPIILTFKPTVALSNGSFGFPSGYSQATGPWPYCACADKLLSRNDFPWFDEKGVRHSPSGCA